MPPPRVLGVRCVLSTDSIRGAPSTLVLADARREAGRRLSSAGRSVHGHLTIAVDSVGPILDELVASGG